MSGISSVASTASVNAATNQVMLASLQAQMMHFSPEANGQGAPASTDYKALQSAITSGNVSGAQAALVRLQRDSIADKPSDTASTAATPAASFGTTVGGVQSSVEGSLDTTA